MESLWKKYLSKRDLRIYGDVGFGEPTGFGKSAALLIIDVIYGFTGDGPEPIEESIKKYPLSCGEESWEAIKHIKKLLQTARDVNIPVVYSIGEGHAEGTNEWIGIKSNFFNHPLMKKRQKGTKVVEEIKPTSEELVISKIKPSIFFGTPLISYLMYHGVDSVIVTGCTTSGCIRASVVDAFSYNYKVIVPYECTFDRGQASHAINLFDMQQKYADVVSTESVIQQLQLK